MTAYDLIQHFSSPIGRKINVIDVIVADWLEGKIVELSFLNLKAQRLCGGLCSDVNSGLGCESHDLDCTSGSIGAFQRAFVSRQQSVGIRVVFSRWV